MRNLDLVNSLHNLMFSIKMEWNIKLLISFIFFLIAYSETPQTICEIDHPFRKLDLNCDNFENICIKKDDETCSTFLSACKQCPSTNFTIIMYQDLLKMKEEFKNAKFEIRNLTVKFNNMNSNLTAKLQKITESQMLTNPNISAIFAFVILNAIILFILFLEIRFKLITKLFLISNKSKYRPIPQVESQRQKDNLVEMKQQFLNWKDELKEEIGKVKESLIQNVKVESNRLKFYIMKEMIDLVLQVHENDNVVKLKRQIMDRIEGRNPNDYKRIKMKYKGLLLDDNKYLLSCIDSPEIPIFCEFDENININETITLKLRANFTVPDMVQIELSQTIGYLKGVISVITGCRSEELMILKESSDLDTEQSVERCGLSDGDWIQVIKKAKGTVLVQSIFNAKTQHSLQYFSTDKVSSLKVKLAEKLNCQVDNLSLFMESRYLKEDDYLYKYNFLGNKSIKYCDFTGRASLYDYGKVPIEKDSNRYVKGKVIKSQKEVLIKSYSDQTVKSEIYKSTNEWISVHLELFLTINSHSRFAQLLDIYNISDHIYLVIENVHGVTLNSFIENENNHPVIECLISKWAKQILEGLEYIHQYHFILKDLNPFRILIDGNHNVKLPNFNWTDYLESGEIDKSHNQVHINVIKYVSPEILREKPFGVKADVWSLGAILIKCHTRKKFYPRSSDNEFFEIIRSVSQITYDDTGMSEELKQFIDLCLITDVNARASVQSLLNKEFITKYQ